MWLESDGPADPPHLIIRQRSARAYDGVDVRVNAPLSAKMTLVLVPTDASDKAFTTTIPLADIAEEYVTKDIDAGGNRLLVVRSPGDQLLVSFNRDALVFSPGETFQFTVEPNKLPLPDGSKAKLKAQLLPAGGGKELWSAQPDFSAGKTASIPLEVTLPREEGVYDIVLTLVNSPSLTQAVRRPLQWNKTLAERRIQLVVIDNRAPAAPRGDRPWSQLLEIDPANSHWWEGLNKLPQLQQLKQLQLTRINRMFSGPLGNDMKQPYKHALGNFVQLKPNAQSPDASWEAYALPIAQPGRPHIVEIEYPSDVPQTLGISLLEPNASGGIAPIGLDSGIDVPAPLPGVEGSPRLLKHRLIFWPRTNAPLLLVSNLRDRTPAVYGKIRVLADGERLPHASVPPARQGQRLIAAYMDRPLLPQNFGAPESFDSWSGRSLIDWITYYESGVRLVDYLQHVGYNGLMLSVLADGSTIYPSEVLEPTPRYDTGMFFSAGQDPVRKDFLEMLLRLFDREGMQLIPTLEFASPLPELEAMRRELGPTKSQSLEWIGPDGKPYSAVYPPQRGQSPYYNSLDPRVQRAMLAVAKELIDRYAQHQSFAGLALRLSPEGYAQLPGPEWGLDDETITRFANDAGVSVPGEGPNRFAERIAFLAQEPNRRKWLEWRAAELGKFHAQLQELIAAVRPDAKLYLAGAGAIGAANLETELRPSLPRRATLSETLLRVGIDSRNYLDNSRIVLLRPERCAPTSELNVKALEMELAELPDADRYFQNTASTGSLFFHPPREIRIDSFDQKSPIKPSYTWLVAQTSASDKFNRCRFVHSLATLDAQAVFDGGWLLPIGQEDSIRDLIAAYRMLPAVKFQPVVDKQSSSQPVTFRTGAYAGKTYLYAVNDAPFRVAAKLRVAATANCRIEELTGARKISPLKPDKEGGATWEVQLEPYDLVAVQLSDPAAQLARPQVSWPDDVEQALSLEIRKLGARAAVLRSPPAVKLLDNADFERPSAKNAAIPGWAGTSRDGVLIDLTHASFHGGKQSAVIASNGPIACLVSQPFAAPTTGRLSMTVWLRTETPDRQPPFRLAIEGKLDGRDYYRYAQVGRPPEGSPPTAALGGQWEQFVFVLDDLPLTGLSPLRVRFDLMGAGQVYIDDVQLNSLAFSQPEIIELSKLITLADVKLQRSQLGDCVRLLEGYWPRFLDENVPLPASVQSASELAKQPPAKKASEEKPAAESSDRTGFLDRVKGMIPDSLKF